MRAVRPVAAASGGGFGVGVRVRGVRSVIFGGPEKRAEERYAGERPADEGSG